MGSEAAARACLEESLDAAATLRLSRATGSWAVTPDSTDAAASAALATVAGALHCNTPHRSMTVTINRLADAVSALDTALNGIPHPE